VAHLGIGMDLELMPPSRVVPVPGDQSLVRAAASGRRSVACADLGRRESARPLTCLTGALVPHRMRRDAQRPISGSKSRTISHPSALPR
jgi:hypothetical protein